MTARRLLAQDPSLLTESQWASLVNELAAIGGWRRYHTYLSKRSPAGFPDLVLVRGQRLIFAELKTDAKTSKVTEQQHEWLEALREVQTACEHWARAVGDQLIGEPDHPSIEVYVWRPSDWPAVCETLTGKRPKEEAA